MSKIASVKATLSELQMVCLSRNIAFVTYCLPDSRDILTLIQYKSQPRKLDSLSQLNSRQGFVLAPFLETEKFPVFLLEPDHIIHGREVDKDILEELKTITVADDGFNTSHDYLYESQKAEFLQQVVAIKKEIQSGSLGKAVFSRIHIVESNDRQGVSEIFTALFTCYPTAFRYVLNIRGAGCWIGASPEPLMEVRDNIVETVSLAGTQKLNGTPAGKVEWQSKEMEEQRFVTAYIESHLNDFGITGYLKRGPFSQQAANLVHLKSTFSFDRDSLGENLGEFISALHPTPSVCGWPKAEAFGLIRHLEKHERGYYSGFLGPINIDGRINLYVNLRCMLVLQRQFALFAGAGITSGSNPEKEWEETELKMQTLLSVLRNMDTKNG
ncbi:MAG: chorismate-binding protein [Bacteroidales bacterium]|nr:chorismate-binding protein [Bacteroidales bacterium]